jgi:hypothetical protein
MQRERQSLERDKMSVFQGQEVDNNLTGDVGLIGFHWAPNGADFVIELILSGGA